MDFELCTDSHKAIKLAEKYDIKRVELCSGLSVGGLTPGIGLVKQCAKSKKTEVHAMLRHREGDFHYSKREISIMQTDLVALKKAGAKGIVFGCLNSKNMIDTGACARLIKQANQYELETTFHRAFDFCSKPFNALEELIELGFDRILTSGQQSKAINGINLIASLVKKADGRIQIMAGSGINQSNALLLANVGVDALHFTAHNKISEDHFGMGVNKKTDEQKIASIINLFS